METTKMKECSRCILNEKDDPKIILNDKGICNHCVGYDEMIVQYDLTPEEQIKIIQDKVEDIKKHGKGQKYDCIMGVSGGVDSTYLCIKLKEYGLRPLLVHFDSGWNSELAVENIQNIIDRLGFDLYTHVVNWEEFKDIQLSYFKAGVMDIEVVSDQGFVGTLYKVAREQNIKYVISGHNVVTEYILPKSMIWSKMDLTNLKDIHSKHGSKRIKTFPTVSYFTYTYYQLTKKFEWVRFLNYMDYNKTKVKEIIIKDMGWRDYGGKHYESVFTRFFQGYILKEKFGFDKRRAHLSNLICSGQMTREEALAEVNLPAYDAEQLKIDREFVIKKLGFTEESFQAYMDKPVVAHDTYKTDTTGAYIWLPKLIQAALPLARILKKVGILSKKKAVQ